MHQWLKQEVDYLWQENKTKARRSRCACATYWKSLFSLSVFYSHYFLPPTSLQLSALQLLIHFQYCEYAGHWKGTSALAWLFTPDTISTIYIQSVVGYQMCKGNIYLDVFILLHFLYSKLFAAYHDLHGRPPRRPPVHGHALVYHIGHGSNNLCG